MIGVMTGFGVAFLIAPPAYGPAAGRSRGVALRRARELVHELRI